MENSLKWLTRLLRMIKKEIPLGVKLHRKVSSLNKIKKFYEKKKKKGTETKHLKKNEDVNELKLDEGS